MGPAGSPGSMAVPAVAGSSGPGPVWPAAPGAGPVAAGRTGAVPDGDRGLPGMDRNGDFPLAPPEPPVPPASAAPPVPAVPPVPPAPPVPPGAPVPEPYAGAGAGTYPGGPGAGAADGPGEAGAPDGPEPSGAPEAPAGPVPPGAGAGSAGAGRCVACGTGRPGREGYCERCGHAQPRARDHVEEEAGPAAAVTDRGLRHHRNEDAFTVAATALPDGSPAVVAVVCDGVSSATRPDEASAAAADTAGASLRAALECGTHPRMAMHEAIVAAAGAVDALAARKAGADDGASGGPDPEPRHHRNAPACTLVGAVVASGLLVVGWVGDSRVYWVPDDRSTPPARLTEDDSWAAQMVAAGLMGEAEAYADARAHAITGWLGADAYELDPHTASFTPDRPGVVVVCTDGLWNYAEAAEAMARVVPPDAAARPLDAARVLLGHALDGGGHDNVTVAVLPVVPAAGAAGAIGDSETAETASPASGGTGTDGITPT